MRTIIAYIAVIIFLGYTQSIQFELSNKALNLAMTQQEMNLNRYMNFEWKEVLKHEDDLILDFSTLKTSATGGKRSVNYHVEGKTS